MPMGVVYIRVFGRRLELWAREGDAPLQSHDFEMPVWECLPEAGEQLRGWVSSLSLEGSRCRVVYASEHGYGGHVASPRSLSAAQTVGSARLSLTEAVTYPIGPNPWAVAQLAQDPRRCERAQQHWLAVVDQESALNAMRGLVSGAGLHFEGGLLGDAVLLARACRAAVGFQGGGCRVVFALGESSCAIAAARDGQLLLARTIGIGLDTMIDSVARDSTDQRGSVRDALLADGLVSEDDEASREMLRRCQTVLQRLAVEIKQSIRFGINESQRNELSTGGAGLTYAVPGLFERLIEQCGLDPYTVIAREEGEDDSLVWWRGQIAPLWGALSLAPGAVEDAQKGRRLSRAMWGGAAAAVAVLVLDGGITQWTLQQSRDQLASLERSGLEAPSTLTAADGLAERAGQFGTLAQVYPNVLGESPDCAAVMAMLAQRTPETVRLRDMNIDSGAERGRCVISGFAEKTDRGVQASVTPYVEDLSASPLVAGVDLGSVRVSKMQGREVVEFDLVLELVQIPASRFLADWEQGP